VSDVQLYVLSCSISILNLVLNLVYRYLGTAVLDLISTKFTAVVLYMSLREVPVLHCSTNFSVVYSCTSAPIA
jgi:hypothetical protein